MPSLSGLAIRRPVATTMVYLILIVLGIVSFRSLPVDLLPAIEFTELTVRTRYPNVGPVEIEQIITDPIENAVSGLPNLERITSRSMEGYSRVRLQFARGTSLDEAVGDLRAVLDRMRDELPLEAEPPEILKLDLDRIDVVSLAATSTHDLPTLTRILEDDLSRRFEQIPGVGQINIRGGILREIRIDLDRDRLKAAGLTALDVQQALARENLTLPGGNVKAGVSDLYVRTVGEYRTLREIERTVIAGTGHGQVRIEDVATVRDDYEDVRYLGEINGMPSVLMRIQKQSGANTVAVARAIREETARINDSREDIHLTIFSDQSEFIRQSIDHVRNSGLWGSLLAVAVLYFFLRRRSSTAIIAVSIPISVIATFALLYFGGLTLNQMTFGGLALGVGLIVDNAIVVLESIVRKREEQGASVEEAARVGSSEVAGAIVASTLTTCVIFLPVVFTRTTSAALFQALALVIVFALACSLLVALTLVPMLAARAAAVAPRSVGAAARHEKPRSPGVVARVESWYTRTLRKVLEHRRWVYVSTGALLAASLVLWQFVPVELTPEADANEIDVEVEMAQGTNVAVVREFITELENGVREVLPPEYVEMVSTETRGGHAEVELRLAPQDRRPVSAEEMADMLREQLAGSIPGAEVRVQPQSGLWILRRVFSSGAGTSDLELELRGWDLRQADRLSDRIVRRISTVPGIVDVQVSRREGQPEIDFVLDRERIAELGISARQVARTVQANVGGIEATRLRDRGEEYPIVVRLTPDDRLTELDLSNVSLETDSGQVIPLSSVVEARHGRGPIEIDRVDSQRVTYITANLAGGLTLGEAIDEIDARLSGLAMPEGFSLIYGGEYIEQQKARKDFSIAILMALALVYMLMAAQFERLIDPLIVMLAVPMALIGVLPMMLLTGTTLNIQSLMGLVMLIGIVVNNAIVLVDAINLLRRERGMQVFDAVVEAGRLRMRPILMTTTTTVLGLAPLALGIGTGAEIQASFARVVIGGLLASSLVTLVLIPAAYLTATRRVRVGP